MAGIINSPALHAELKANYPAIIARTEGCGGVGVRDVIGRRFATFPQPDRSDMEWAAWWADYYDALADLPLAALEGGMRAYLRQADAEFMPKPGKLRELALKAGEPLWQAASRARRAANLPIRGFEPVREETPEAKAERQRLVEEVKASLRMGGKPEDAA